MISLSLVTTKAAPSSGRRGPRRGRKGTASRRAFEAALDRWLGELLPDIEPPSALARVLRGSIYGFFIEYLPLPFDDRMRYLSQRADEIAEVFVPH